MGNEPNPLLRAAEAMESVTVFVTSCERIKRPEGDDWWQEEIAAVRAAAGAADDAKIESILAMPEDELRKRYLANGECPDQAATIGRLCFDVASLRAKNAALQEEARSWRAEAERLETEKKAAAAARPITPETHTQLDDRDLCECRIGQCRALTERCREDADGQPR